jgi:hypothetical protein
MLVVALIAPCLIFITACGNDIGKRLTAEQWDEVKEDVLQAAGGFFEGGFIAGEDGFQIKANMSSKGRVTCSARGTAKGSSSVKMDIKMSYGEEAEDTVMSMKMDARYSESSRSGKSSGRTKANYYFEDGVLYDAVYKLKLDAVDLFDKIEGPMEDIFEDGADLFDINPFAYMMDNDFVKVNKLEKGGNTTYTIALDYKKVIADVIADLNEAAEEGEEFKATASGKMTLTVVFNDEDEVIEVKMRDNSKIRYTEKSDGEETVYRMETKGSMSMSHFSGTIKAPRGISKFADLTTPVVA